MKKSIARLMVLVMVLAIVLIGGTVVSSAEDETTGEALSWNGLHALFDGQYAGTDKITTVVLAHDISAEGSEADGVVQRVVVPEGRKLTLDMNGYSIDGAADMYKDITVHGELEIINSKETVSSIRNFSNYAIWIAEDGKVTVNDGVKICDNTGAAAVYTQGSFIMNGGEISRNTVVDDDENPVGGAVVVDEAGSLTLKGNPKLSNNVVNHEKGGSYNCDVILINKASRIVLPEELKMEYHPIGVAARSDMIITTGWTEFNKDKDPAEYFATVRMNSSISLDKTSGELKYTIKKAANTLSVKAKPYTVKYNVLKKKSQTIARKKVLTVTGAKGTVTYSKASGNKKITVSKKGNITLKKGLKKGTYKVAVKVKAAGNSGFQAKTIKKTVVIRVK